MTKSKLLSFILPIGLLAACAETETSVKSTSTTSPETTVVVEATTTTTINPVPLIVYPLTGLDAETQSNLARPALVAKIDNQAKALPQSGVNEADIVYEELINDGLTRLALVFHSGDSTPVGPFRSGRVQDVDLFGSFGGPLFAWSGGNDSVEKAIRRSDFVNLDTNHAPYYRSDDRVAPHNLYSSTPELYAAGYAVNPGALTPPQQFEYRYGEDSPGLDVGFVAIQMNTQYLVTWTWNPAIELYERTQDGEVHVDEITGSVVTTNNVVILAMEYKGGISGSPDAVSIGTGEAAIYTDGKYIHGTWTRADRLQPFTLRDDAGNVIKLTPGRTFIELPRIGDNVL